MINPSWDILVTLQSEFRKWGLIRHLYFSELRIKEGNMLLDLVDYETKARSAVKTFWISRKKAGTCKLVDCNLNGFIDLVIGIVRANGLTNADILWKSKLAVLPGHFCPTQ
jgi:hypothetical protein